MARHHPRYPGPVRPIVVGGDRHALDHAIDPRIVVEGDGPPDLVFTPAARLGVVAVPTPELDPAVVERIRTGRATLVLDASGEGPAFTKRVGQAIHNMLRDLALPAGRVAYLTQNRDFAAAYRAWCGEGVVPVTVIVHDYYFSRYFRDQLETGAETFAERLARFEAREAERKKRFVCLNFSLRPSKVLLLLALIRGRLWNDGFISFPGFDPDRHARAVSAGGMARDVYALPGLRDEARSLLREMDALSAQEPSVFGMTSGAKQHVKSILQDTGLEIYNRSWFTVITETEVVGTRRVTEKPLKPFANFSPALIWGNPGSLALLRGFDFKTFGELIVEDYDEEEDPSRRFELVLAEIHRLCALPEEALAHAERRMADVLAHNADRALVQMPRIYRDKYEPRLIDQLLDLSPRREKL